MIKMTHQRNAELDWFCRYMDLMGDVIHDTVVSEDPTACTRVKAIVYLEEGLETVREAPSSIEWDEEDMEPHCEVDLDYLYSNTYKVEVEHIWGTQLTISKRSNDGKKDIELYTAYFCAGGFSRGSHSLLKIMEVLNKISMEGKIDDESNYLSSEWERFEREYLQEQMDDAMGCAADYI